MEYKEVETTMGELQDGDLVKGTDGKWYPIKILDIQKKKIYQLNTNAGTIQTSYDHDWIVFADDDYLGEQYTTEEVYERRNEFRGYNLGVKDGPILENVEEIGEKECRCIQTEAPGHLFEVYTSDGQPIFSKNCSGRLVAGRLNSTASLMALGNSLATGIDGNHKGAGIVSVDGQMSNVQYYYADPSWIEEWFKARGMDKNGREPGKSQDKEIVLEGEEEFSIRDGDEVYKFEDIEKKVVNKKEQKFENI